MEAECWFRKLLFNATKNVRWLFRPNGCWWRGWGRRVWNWVREKPTSQACRRTPSSTVCVTYWREPGATVCSWNRSDLQKPSGNVFPCVNKQQRWLYEQAEYWRVFILNRGSPLFGPICFITRRPRWRRRRQLSLQVRAQTRLFFFFLVYITELRVERSLVFNSPSLQCPTVRTRERLMMALWF